MSAGTPRRFGYRVGAALIVIGLALVIAFVTLFLTDVADRAPSGEQTLGNNESTTVHVDDGGSKSIYTDTTLTSDAAVDAVTCAIYPVTGAPAKGDIPYVQRTHFNVPVSNWRPAFSFTVQKGGDYSVRCTDAPAEMRLAIGEYAATSVYTYQFLAVGLGILATIAGVGVVVETWFRRSRVQPAPAGSVEPAVPESAVEPAVSEGAVEPAAPESAVEPAVPESAVQPAVPESPHVAAAPEDPVEPAVSESAVETAASEGAVEPAAPESAVETSAPESAVEPAVPESAVEPVVPASPVEPAAPESPDQAAVPQRPAD